MLTTYPLMTVMNDAGDAVSGATVTVASVKDRDGADVSTPGAVVHLSGANASVAYDADLHGEAWVTLSISKAGETITGLRASPAFYLSADPGRIAALAAEAPVIRLVVADSASTTLQVRVSPAPGSALPAHNGDLTLAVYLLRVAASSVAGLAGQKAFVQTYTRNGDGTATIGLSTAFGDPPAAGDSLVGY